MEDDGMSVLRFGTDRRLFSPSIVIVMTLVVVAAVRSAVADHPSTPLWKLGISTFKASKNAPADAPPSYPFPEVSSAEYQAEPNESEPSEDGKVAKTNYLDDPLALTPPSVPVPSAELELPIPSPSPGTAASDIAPAMPIGSAVAAGDRVEAAPLAEETTSWYEVPWKWLTRGWDNHAEFGLDGSSGNARTLALQTGLEMKRKTDRYTRGIDFDYLKATTTGLTTEDNGRFDVDYDRIFTVSKCAAFAKFGSECDQFKAFDSRLNLNGGVGYFFVRNDDALFSTRFGAGASKEIGAPDDDWKAEAVFGTEAEYQLNRYNKMKGKVEYFPAWEDFSDFRVVSDFAWEILLDDSDNLSLKLALTDRYDSTPQGAKANDVYYSLLLLVKF